MTARSSTTQGTDLSDLLRNTASLAGHEHPMDLGRRRGDVEPVQAGDEHGVHGGVGHREVLGESIEHLASGMAG